MGKSSRQKRRTYQTPKRSRNGANLVWYAMAGILVVAGALGVALSRSNSASGEPPTTADHWHIALGVNDCGKWVPNWLWPPGNVTGSSASAGAPARAGSGGLIYAPLHSHGDGLIHIEPLVNSDGGKNATLGAYFRYGGWKLNATSIQFVNVNEKNGNTCDGKPGVLRWAVNGKEKQGDPSKYKLVQADIVELVFTTASAKLPPPNQVPSDADLQQALGVTPTTLASSPSTSASTQSTVPTSSTPTTSSVGNTTTSKP